MPSEEPYQGVAGRILEESTPWWPALPSPPPGAPNVLVFLLDDVGYAQVGPYGSDIATPTFDRLATGGIRFSNFHTTALCSPTRACLLSGRNHHSNGMGRVAEIATGFPGYDSVIPRSNGLLPEILLRHHYATFAVGKWHLTPAGEMTAGGPKDKWPLGRGFERYYGYLAGETDQYHPDLVYDNHQVDPPRTPEEGYHLTEDLADKAVMFINDLRAVRPDQPFLLWFAPGACHAPHQAPRHYIDRYAGRFDLGWDAWREQVFARQVASGLLPAGTRLSERPRWIAAWDSLTADQRRLYARMMEVYAGFLEHTDAQFGRVIDHLEALGELDNTIVLAMSDNGASAEGGAHGLFNDMYFFNFEPESLEENLRRIDDLGTPRAHNHYPWGWAWAGNTPLKRWKRETHEGGVTDPLIVHWPAGLGRRGETRHQYVHAIDVLPTLLEAIGVDAQGEINGVAQSPIEGVSFFEALQRPDAVSRHTTQYYEMLGSRALYHDGWKAVVFHPLPGLGYDGSDPMRPFDQDEWELYHVAEDFSETEDLAEKEPDKLAELVELWWREAERYHAVPLTNMPIVGRDGRYQRDRYEFRPGIGTLTELVAPNVRNRAWRLLAELVVPEAGVDGIIACQGGSTGGWAVAVRDGRLRFVHNYVGTTVTTVGAEMPVPAGPVVARVEFTPTGTLEGDVALYYGDVPVGEGHVARTPLVTFGDEGFTVGYQRGTSITPELDGRCEFTPGALMRVIVEAEGPRHQHAGGEQRARMARQ